MLSHSSLQHARMLRAAEVGEWGLYWRVVPALLIALSTSAVAGDTDPYTGISFNIPQQRANLALTRFAEQADLTLIFPFDDVRDKMANRLVGAYPLEEAIEVLLAGTGLKPTFSSRAVLNIAVEKQNEPRGISVNVKNKKKAGLGAFLAAVFSVSAGAQEAADAEEIEIDEIVVTGSRIARSSFDSPTPLTVIDSAVIDQSGVATLDDVLIRTPALAVGQGLRTGTNRGLNSGATFLNLRGLGLQRTLTLVDGKRRVPGTGTASAVDLSAIAPSQVERIEIITGGTSAIYGADAVTGVVNVILKRNYDGFGIRSRVSATDEGGGQTEQVSIYGGTPFSDNRGNVSFSMAYNRSALLNGTQRDFTQGNNALASVRNMQDTGTGDGIPDFISYRNPVQSLFAETGTFFFFGFDPAINADRWFIYTADPGLREQAYDVNPQTFPNGFVFNAIASGGDGFEFTKYINLRPEQQNLSSMFNLDYELADSLNWYASFDSSNTRTTAPFEPNFHPADGDGIVVSRDNPLIPAEVQQFMDNVGFTSLSVQRTHQDLGVRVTSVERNMLNALTGFRGKLADRWNYDVFFQYGRQNISSSTSNTMLRERYLQAVDVISDPATGEPVCRDPAARAAGCLPVAVLGSNDGIVTPATLSYFMHNLLREMRISQAITGAHITGDLLELPAGKVGIAAGAEFRREKLSFRDDGANVLGALLLNQASAATDGALDIAEGFAEIAIPILADAPFAKQLEIEGAFRYSDYSTIGSTTAWKAAGSWMPTEDVRFRATRAKSVRAPTLSDLFNPGLASFTGINDPCDARNISNGTEFRAANCAALGIPATFEDPNPTSFTKRLIAGGNPDLEPEESDSWTLGAVFTPRFAPGLRLSVDLWEIDLSGAIQRVDLTDIVQGCVDDGPQLNNPLCNLVTRRADFVIDTVRLTSINVGEMTANGVDFQIDYRFDVGNIIDNWPGSLNFVVNGVYLDEVNILIDPSNPDSLRIEAGEVSGTALPHWRGNVNIGYSHGPLALNWFVNYVGKMDLENQPPGDDFVESQFRELDAKVYNNLFLSYQLSDSLRVSGGINNLFYTKPPRNPETFAGGDGIYDVLGRTLFVGFSFDL